MKKNGVAVFLVIVLLICGVSYLALNGVGSGTFGVKSIADSMKLGLDIEGGVVVVYEAKTDATGSDLLQLMNQTKNVIVRRVNSMGLTEPNITIQGDKRIRIELPGVKNANDAISMIGKTAQLEFVLVDQKSVARSGMTKDAFVGTQILTGQEVKDSKLSFDKYNKPGVGLEFNTEGTKLFRTATESAVAYPGGKGQIAIILDDNVISAPYTSIVIGDGKAVITGNFTVEEATNLASLIRGGALPVNLDEVQTSVIGPTLGLDALKTSVNAAKIGLLLVVLFMLVFYRVPGFIASIALVLYAGVLLFIMVGFNATLTLPGVAGIVLSLGMAVDANVIIFERIKEELRNGKTLRASIDSGFSRALRTIIDSNVTTFIAAIVLFTFGEGPIKGFAVTLMIGIVTSMFTAVVVTKTLLKSSLSFKGFNSNKMYGVRGGN
ncbi:protein translocase subunit SecD [Helicovermis profundi]|uniref:Protein translocase subunit SecD n=1 Tax=Helicovermis profundi TaxID=3065157 RepID=A0AAU9E3Z6_9FIRM|nr:protein translocase subunit SecD [Clostridia bacterium S502]